MPFEFLFLNQLLQKVSAVKSQSNSGEYHDSHHINMHAFDHHSDSLDDETKYYFIAEFVWPAQSNLVPCSSLKLIHKNPQTEMKFVFYYLGVIVSLMRC